MIRQTKTEALGSDGEDDTDMDRAHYDEMQANLDKLIRRRCLQHKKIYLFGHCNATEELVKCLTDKGVSVSAILDNNREKQGKEFRGIRIQDPQTVLAEPPGQAVVCIAARAFAEMADQLKRLGYTGPIHKLVEYNSYAEYSLSEATISDKKARVEAGIRLLEEMEQSYPGCFRILCPFSALGDIYIMMSYLPHFLQKRNIETCVVAVVGRACAEVVRLFGAYEAVSFPQQDMDRLIQAVLYTKDDGSFIAHQDRPYVVNLHRALYVKCIPLEQMYCCGVFGLPAETRPCRPDRQQQYGESEWIRQGRAVIFSPYAKSVTALPESLWENLVAGYLEKGYQCFTNVAGEEKALPGTEPISPKISEIQSAAELAGTFIGIRSGICDVLKEAKCRKVALYPDYNYCDTKWKAIDMYAIEGWENIVIKDGFEWKRI